MKIFYNNDDPFSFRLKEKKKSRILLENFRCTRITATKKEKEKKKNIFRDFDEVAVSREHRERERERKRERKTLGGQVKNDCKIIDDCQPFLNPKRASRYVYTHDTDTRTRSSLSLSLSSVNCRNWQETKSVENYGRPSFFTRWTCTLVR